MIATMAAPSRGPQLVQGEDEAERYLAQHPDLETVEMLLTDTNGVIRGKWAPPSTLRKVFDGGIQLPLSLFGLDVWGREVPETGLHIETGDRDGNCLGVPGSILPVTWARRPTAQVLLSMHEPDGSPFFADPRHRLRAVLDRFTARGLNPVVAFELEFYLVRPGFETEAQASPLPDTHGRGHGPERQRMYSIAELSSQEEFFASLREAAAAQRIPIDTIISEAGPGQFEVNLAHRGDAMAAADDALLLRRLIGGTARRHGLRASFMAKPFQEWPGNGMHVHVSLEDGTGVNVFSRGEDGDRLLKSAVAGTLKTMPDCLALFINTFNGYRRLAPGSYAPTRVTWGSNNRSVAVRVPIAKPEANRLEHRIAGADANPYLVLAAILAGIERGLEDELTAPPAVEGNAYEGAGQGEELTDYMEEAVETFERSSFIAEAFGAEFRHLFAELKKAEQAVFDERISRLEHETYL